jgi:hypothetical protein
VSGTVNDFAILSLTTPDVENASNTYSAQYLTVTVSGAAGKYDYLDGTWTQVEDILMSSPYDKHYQVINSDDRSKVYFKFGDDVTGSKLPPNSLVTIQYLETLGFNGNVASRFKVRTVKSLVIPNDLYVTNDLKILGGKEIESFSSIRQSAPKSYLKHYTIATVDSYESIILDSIPSADKVKVFGASFTDPTSSVTRDVVYISAINTLGELIVAAEAEVFIRQVVDLIGMKKAPTDSLMYIDPVGIRLRSNNVVYTSSIKHTEDEIKSTVLSQIENSASIFNKNFEQALFKSEIDQLVNKNDFTKYSENFFEAVSIVDFSNYEWDNVNRMFKFYFSFNSLFSKDSSYSGFKTFYGQSVYFLLRVEILWTDEVNISKNRTFFLLDSRLTGTWGLSHAWDDINNQDPKLRTGQWLWIKDTVFDSRTMKNKIIPKNVYPQEVTFYEQDSTGANILDDGQPIRNVNFIGNESSRKVRILFNEVYDVTDPLYATGSISLPATPPSTFTEAEAAIDTGYVPFTGSTTAAYEYLQAFKDKMQIKVFAQPLATNIVPAIPNSIIYIDPSDVVTEVVHV